MKVGVITFHSANNYGAILQTWALQKVLKDYGLDSGVIHYHPDAIDILYDPMKLSKGAKRLLHWLKVSIKYPDRLVKYRKFLRFMQENINLIGDYRTYGELKKANLELDAYIVGSDQVWNIDHTNGYDPAYLLEFAGKNSKKIAYAASVGKDYIPGKVKENFRRALSSFTAISVREESVKEEIETLAEKPVEVVLDPTLLLKKEDYEEIKVKSPIKEPYILVYMMEKNPQVIKLANKLSVALGMPVIQRRPTAGFENELPPFYTQNTGEFIGLIESASYVITNSFHGTVFSIIYERPFISMLHSDTGSRTEDLLKALHLESHLLYDVKEFHDFKKLQIDNPEQLRKRIDELQQGSREFLKKSLGI